MATYKIKSIEAKLTKAGYIITRDDIGRYCASKPDGLSVIEYFRNGREEDYTCSIRVRRKADLDDSMSDYFAGSFATSIKDAIELAGKMHGWALEAAARKAAAPPPKPEPTALEMLEELVAWGRENVSPVHDPEAHTELVRAYETLEKAKEEIPDNIIHHAFA